MDESGAKRGDLVSIQENPLAPEQRNRRGKKKHHPMVFRQKKVREDGTFENEALPSKAKRKKKSRRKKDS